MGFKLANDTDHPVVAIVLTYLPTPTPSLFYHQVVVVQPRTRVNCHNWNCPCVVYAFAPPVDDINHIAGRLRTAFSRFNVVRAGLVMFGGAVMDVLDIFSGLFDVVVETIIELVLQAILNKIDDTVTDDAWDSHIRRALNSNQLRSNHKLELVRTMYTLGVGGLGLRRQYSIGRCASTNALMIQGKGVAFFG